jgi:hypothetical protein
MSKRIIFTICFYLILAVIQAQPGAGESRLINDNIADLRESGQNRLTIFVIPSKVKYDWTSPRTLYKSYFKNYEKNIFNKKAYNLGHAFLELCTPLASDRILAGMRAATGKEQKDLVLKEHYGLAILGADMDGTLQTDSELVSEVQMYSRKGELAFITFFISDEATERLLRFFQSFKAEIDSNGSYGARYGGAFWPRYKGEGSGCSAFVMTFMDLAGLLKDEFSQWLVKVNIPMDLIGGPYNNGHEVQLSDIKKRTCWSENCEPADVTCEPFEIYDPTLIYEWIQAKWQEENPPDNLSYTPLRLNEAKGILIDSRNQPLPGEDSIFMEREKPSIFIDYYHQKYRQGN